MEGDPETLGAFDRTYEGLKHKRIVEGGNPTETFDRTYEGLKPGVDAPERGG